MLVDNCRQRSNNLRSINNQETAFPERKLRERKLNVYNNKTNSTICTEVEERQQKDKTNRQYPNHLILGTVKCISEIVSDLFNEANIRKYYLNKRIKYLILLQHIIKNMFTHTIATLFHSKYSHTLDKK